MKITNSNHSRLLAQASLVVGIATGLAGSRVYADSPAVSGSTNAPTIPVTSTVKPADTNDIPLDELINIKVTSVSKKEENLFDAPAAISVLSNEDLRRSGATSIAESLRWVPGLDVGQVNSSQWAISSRGFNSLYADKLLVLVDGRAIYSPLFGGVYWDLQQNILADLDRIEVIRGPGATIWGANAVNGVINVVSSSARDTQGGLVEAGGGDQHQVMTAARYGGQLSDNTYYRVFGGYELNDDYQQANGQSAKDGWQSEHGGFRLDSYPHPDTQLTWQADATGDELDDNVSSAYNVNTLGRWSRQISERSSIEVQAYYDRTYRDEVQRALTSVDTVDLSAQQTFGLGKYNDVIWGLGYRFMGNEAQQTTPAVEVMTHSFVEELFSGFVQDELKIIPDRLTLTAGTKLEHNDFTGFEVQPSGQLTFKPADNQTLWVSVSRAVRTPDALQAKSLFNIDFGAPFVGPGGLTYIPTLVGNPNLKSETLLAYEAGYRIQPVKWISADVTAFFNHYNDVISVGQIPKFIPGAPFGIAELPWANNQSGHTVGGEAALTVSPTEHWRLIASYSLLREVIQGQPSTPIDDPENQATLRSSYDFTKSLSLDAQLRFVDKFSTVPSYWTADVRLSYRPIDSLEISLVGQNLFEDQHLEQPALPFVTTAEIPRGFYGKVTWRF